MSKKFVKDYEFFGLLAEIVGLTLLLIAAVWQISFTDWFDHQYFESVHFVQEGVNGAILDAELMLAAQMAQEDVDKRKQGLNEIYDRVGQARSAAIEDRQRRDRMMKGQGAAFKSIRAALFVLGSLLIVTGKIMVLRHKKMLVTP